MSEEVWRPVVGYEEYQVSNLGRVRGKGGGRRWEPGALLTLRENEHRLQVTLHPTGRKIITIKVHKLVMITFVGPCPQGMEICHGDGNFKNNRLENLRYDTHRNNALDTITHGTNWRRTSRSAKLTEEIVLFIREHREITGKELAARFGVSKGLISEVRSEKRWKTCNDTLPPADV